jgi:heme-degrading monooxygenase HmoA
MSLSLSPLVCVLMFATVLFTATARAEPLESGQVLKHMVMYKFNDDCTPEQIQEVIDAFSALPKKIDAIIGFERGTNVSREGKSEGLTHCFVVTFRDEAGLEAYLKHPAHDNYVKVVRDKREKVVVFDYWVGADDAKAARGASVSGTVTVRGEPLAAGKITFRASKGPAVEAKVEEGQFKFDRLTPGKYAVAIAGEGVDKKYSAVEATSLVVEVRDDANMVSFELQ